MKLAFLLALIGSSLAQESCDKLDSMPDRMPTIKSYVDAQTEIIKQLNAANDAIARSKKDYEDAIADRVDGIKKGLAAFTDEVSALIKTVDGLKADAIKNAVAMKNPKLQSVKLGDRWVIRAEGDQALVFRDLKTGGDKRYAFYNGGFSDMYKAGSGGEIAVNKVSFPTRWSISEESGSFLVARDTSATKDSRYAFSATKYVDL